MEVSHRTGSWTFLSRRTGRCLFLSQSVCFFLKISWIPTLLSSLLACSESRCWHWKYQRRMPPASFPQISTLQHCFLGFCTQLQPTNKPTNQKLPKPTSPRRWFSHLPFLTTVLMIGTQIKSIMGAHVYPLRNTLVTWEILWYVWQAYKERRVQLTLICKNPKCFACFKYSVLRLRQACKFQMLWFRFGQIF